MNEAQGKTEGKDDAVDYEVMERFLMEGGTFAMLHEVSESQLESLYSLAFSHYQSGRFNEAQALFKGLAMLNHYDARFFLGLGASRQALGLHQEAFSSYAFGAMLAVEDPRYPFYAAECQQLLGDRESARSGYEMALALAGDDAQHAVLSARARVLLESIDAQEE